MNSQIPHAAVSRRPTTLNPHTLYLSNLPNIKPVSPKIKARP